MKHKSVRIVSDGTPFGTKVYDAETGAQIHGVRNVSWNIGIEKAGTANIEFVCPEVELIAKEAESKSVAVVDITSLSSPKHDGTVFAEFRAAIHKAVDSYGKSD